MNTRFSTMIAVVAVLIAAAALWIAMSARKQAAGAGEWGNQEPNVIKGADRVKDAAERVRMEQYVEGLQAAKRVLKSFPGPSGETIDCVDIFAQPALRRQGMEGHQVQLLPSSRPPAAQDQSLSRAAKVATPDQLFTLTGQSCPEKTAPMGRLSMDTLKRFRTLDDFLRKQSELRKPVGGGSTSSSPPHEYAHASRGVANWGAESIFTVFSPYVEQANEFSLSQMWVTRGGGANLETVEGGIQVYRDFYGDWRSHLFIYFTPDNYGSGGCYNTSCNGFVQVNNSVYLGGGFTNYSTRGGQQWEIKLLWYKDGTEGHWWLRYGDTWVGYYPRTLFDSNGLRDAADLVDFGGEIVNTSTDGRHTRTDMGSGHWPYEGYSWAAYQRAIRYVDTSNFYQRATGLSRSVTNNMCYDLDLQSSTGDWEEFFYFGGSGFNSSCP